MGLRSRLGHRRVLASVGGGVLLLLLATVAVGWYIVGEERRAGRLLSTLLSREIGVPIRVERAIAERSRLTLLSVGVRPGRHWGGSVQIREIRLEGGVLPLVLPRGRQVAVTAVATSVTLPTGASGLAVPAAHTLTAARNSILRFLHWPGALALEVAGAELRSGAERLSFDLKGEKSGDGTLQVVFDARRPGEATALHVEARGAPAGPDLRFAVRAQADPRRLGAFWPSTLPAPGRVSAEGSLSLSSAPELEITGSLTATPPGGGDAGPLAARIAARYRPLARRVELPLLALHRGPALALDLTGSAEEVDTTPRLMVKMTGTVDGSGVTGEATYTGASGELQATADLRPFSPDALLERFGYARLPLGVRASRAGVTLDGKIEPSDRVRLRGVVAMEGVEIPPWGTGSRLSSTLRVDAAVSRGVGGIALAALDAGELALASSSGEIGRLTVRPGLPGTLAVDAAIPDLSRLPAVDALPLTLHGEARVGGTLRWPGPTPRFEGQLVARVPRGEVTAGGPIVLSDLRVSLPLAWGPHEEAPAGSVTADSLSAFGFIVRRVASTARQRGNALSLPDIRYVHYGGTGKGSARLEPGGAVPLTVKLEGEGVDLATLATEYGLTLGRITGTVGYLLVLQHSPAQGLVAAGRVASAPPGGEVNIDALKKLLVYAEHDPSGILRRTLESLTVFSYASLTGDIRVGPQDGRITLSLEGKKRFGLFPGPIRAINFQNVPLSLLVKTFGHSRRDPP